MHRGCIKEYLKGERSWTQKKKLIYEAVNDGTTSGKTENNISCKDILDNMKAILDKKYSVSVYK